MSEINSKIVNVDYEVISNLKEFITSVYSICEVLSYLGEVRLSKSIEVVLPKSKTSKEIEEVSSKFSIIERIQLPVNLQGRQFVLPVVFYVKSIIPLRRNLIYRSGNSANDIRSIVLDVTETLDLLKFEYSNVKKFIKYPINRRLFKL